MKALLRQLDTYERALVARGFPPLSPWWRRTFEAFLRGGKRQLVLRVGRRGGKSSSLCRQAVFLALYVSWTIPPGDVGTVVFVSVSKDEAGSRLHTIRSILDAIGVPHKPHHAGGIELLDRPIVFRVVAATVPAVSGFTTIVAIADEVAKWRDVETGSNPAQAVLAALRPTMATQPFARLFLSSSPLGVDDAHAQAFDLGATQFQDVATAPSWEANPTLSELETRALEPDPQIHAREYGAQPSEGVSSFTAEELNAVTRRGGAAWVAPIPGTEHVIGIDVGLRKDRTAIVVTRREQRTTPEGSMVEVVNVVAVSHLVPRFLRPVTLEAVVQAVVEVHRRYPGRAYADGHYFDALAPALAERGVTLLQSAMAPSATAPRIIALQRHLSSQSIELPPHPELRKELLQAVLVRHSGGRLTLKAPERAGAHDDLVSALLLAIDPTSLAKIMPADIGGGVLVRETPLWVNFEHGQGITAGEPRWLKVSADGTRRHVPPPQHHRDFEAWAKSMLAQGISTVAIEQWAQANGLRIDLAARDFVPLADAKAQINVPIIGG